MMPSPSDPLEEDADGAGDELEFAPAFASGDSLRPAPQEAKDEAMASRTQFGPPSRPGRSQSDESDHQRAAAILERYGQLRLSYVDALLLTIAERHRIEELITADMRHFGAVKLAHRMTVTRV